MLTTFAAAFAQPKTVSVCALARDSQMSIGHEVEVSAILHVGDGHYAMIQDARCSFRFATGDDYQTFGNTYPVERDTQWELMKEALARPACSHLNTRLVKGRFKGKVIRVPRSGTIPQNEMPVELVIQAAADIAKVDVQCPAED
jgi:hypothetical protein